MTPPNELAAADAALLATVDGLGAEHLTGPSLLPGWTRFHVLAHLALNAEAFVRVLRGATAGRPAPMYSSSQARDEEIDDLVAQATGSPAVVHDRLREATDAFTAALAATPESAAGDGFERTPGSGAARTVGAVGAARLDEVLIHHADLGAGFGPADWTKPYACGLLERIGARPGGPDLVVHATDADRRWTLGTGGPVVSGPATLLAWWLTGRDPAVGQGSGRLDDVLTVDGGDLPQIGAW